MAPMLSPLQLKCQSSASDCAVSKPPEVAPNAFTFTAKHLQVLYMAQELCAWNL